MEDYVDDILVKSHTFMDHLAVLEKVFDRLAKYHLMLNPKKCVFGVTSGKLLGFIVSKRGIEIDPKKVKAILDMPPPQTLRQLRSLQGKLQSVRRFISQLLNKCMPFAHLLKKDENFKWDRSSWVSRATLYSSSDICPRKDMRSEGSSTSIGNTASAP
ncbi:reverse transcriptase domain-containing protein [Enterobacter hormaechei]|uniref:reverse transcriptase domain-containing protein n=1 Tax=Enterobacter hormaechei TaxID=158836 RepID=UPI003CC53E90